MKLIIDTDPGVDDALAILYAAADPEIELLGLTTVFGNVTVAQATRNALHLVERIGHDVPVAQGAAQPLVLPPFAPSHHVHGPEGFGALAAPLPRGAPHTESAAEFLCRTVREHPGDVVVCPIGPITNIAAAIEMDPGFATNVREIVVMGGALDAPGNVTPFAEANTYHDPHALDVVLASGAPITMVGLDVTLRVLLTDTDFDLVAASNIANGSFLKDISRFYLDFYRSIGLTGCGLHDPMTLIAARHPELFSGERTPLSVDLEGPAIGKTRRTHGRPSVNVLLDCDAEAIKARFLDALVDPS